MHSTVAWSRVAALGEQVMRSPQGRLVWSRRPFLDTGNRRNDDEHQEDLHMAFGRRMAAVNRRVTNRAIRPLAPRLPGFGVIVHTGRRSGRTYRTPVNVFRIPGGYVVALTYGADSEWVRNVVAAGGCELETRGRRQHLEHPEFLHDEMRSPVPPPVRPMLRLLRLADFLQLTTVQRSDN
jgi:deazaflavin-dependent oxidoreductase (nitroreductase family)